MGWAERRVTIGFGCLLVSVGPVVLAGCDTAAGEGPEAERNVCQYLSQDEASNLLGAPISRDDQFGDQNPGGTVCSYTSEEPVAPATADPWPDSSAVLNVALFTTDLPELPPNGTLVDDTLLRQYPLALGRPPGSDIGLPRVRRGHVRGAPAVWYTTTSLIRDSESPSTQYSNVYLAAFPPGYQVMVTVGATQDDTAVARRTAETVIDNLPSPGG